MNQQYPVRRRGRAPAWDLDEFFRAPFSDWTRNFLPAKFMEGEESKLPVPAVELTEQDGKYVVTVEVSGMSPEDVDINLSEDGLLTISGEKKREQEFDEGKMHYSERSFGSFQRTMRLPVEIERDAIDASYSHGVITVELPKQEKSQPKAIEIKLRKEG